MFVYYVYICAGIDLVNLTGERVHIDHKEFGNVYIDHKGFTLIIKCLEMFTLIIKGLH